MAKNSVPDWSETAADNTDIAGVNIDEGCAPSDINNAIRTVMAQLKTFFKSTVFRLRDGTDQTKLLALDLSGLTTATTRTLTVQDKNGTIALVDDVALKVDIRRNLWVNGSFSDSQENGNTLGTANGYYPADQIALYFTAATAAMSVQRIQARTLARALDQIEFKTTMAKATLGASDFVALTQNIEGSAFASSGFGTAAAVPLVLRAEVKLPAGTYHFHVSNSANDRHCAIPFTITGDEINTPTVKEIIVPPDTSGTWLTADGVIGITCDLVLAAGSSKTGGTASTWGGTAYLAATAQKNILDSTANVARLADIGLRLDPDATGVYGAYEVGEVDAVFRSERYVYKTDGAVSAYPTVSGYAAAGATLSQSLSFPVRMAKIPSGVVRGTWAASNCAQPTVGLYSRDGFTVRAVVTSLGSAFFQPDSVDDVLQFSARLS